MKTKVEFAERAANACDLKMPAAAYSSVVGISLLGH